MERPRSGIIKPLQLHSNIFLSRLIVKRSGEYAHRGDYHIHPEKDWPYLPVLSTEDGLGAQFLNSCSRDQVVYDMAVAKACWSMNIVRRVIRSAA